MKHGVLILVRRDLAAEGENMGSREVSWNGVTTTSRLWSEFHICRSQCRHTESALVVA